MSTWQKIDTAPKDRTRVLLYQPDGQWNSRGLHRGAKLSVGYWHQPGNPNADGLWVSDGGAFRPTHWMKLPEPPA